jgi:hypothetical protein
VSREVAPLLLSAMGIFVLTVVMGILNGTDVVDLDHGTLLAHVHSGTLGWITLSIFAAAAWIFDGARMPRLLRDGAIAAVVLYAGRALTVPRLSMLLASINLVIGAVLGVILGLALAGTIDVGDEIAGAHPAMMVVGYLILAGVALDEQLLTGSEARPVTRAGRWQALLFFLAGIALAVGILFDVQPLLGLNLLGELAGVVIVFVRLRGGIAGAGWSSPSPARYGATSVLWLLPALALLGYLIVRYAETIDSAPRGLLLGLDHSTFVGILTNTILGLLLVATAARRATWAWADQLVFWRMNIGLAGFVIGLVAEVATVKRVFTPIMGAAILLGLLTATVRLREARAVEPASLGGASSA